MCVVARVALVPNPPNDYWWPIVQGRALEQLGHIPASNLFLYTIPADTPFMNQPWLAQWSMWQVAQHLGHGAMVWLHALLIAGAVLVALEVATRREHAPRALGALAGLGVILASSGISIRTRMFAYPLMICVLGVSLLVSEQKLRWRWFGLAAAAAALWANVHGSFLLAPLLVGAVGFGETLECLVTERTVDKGRISRWGGAVLAIVCATLLNPHGVRVWTYAFSLSSKMSRGGGVTEWEPFAFDAVGIFFYISLILSLLLGCWRFKVVGLRALVPMLGLSVLAATSARSAIWWGLSLVVCLAPLSARAPLLGNASDEERAEVTRTEGGINLGLLGLLVLAFAMLLPGLPGHKLLTQGGDPASSEGFLPYAGYETMNRQHPLRIIGDLSTKGYEGRLFHAQAIGGALEFSLARQAPAQVVFVDQRFGMIPDEIWEDYFAIMAAQQGWGARLEDHGVGVVLLDKEESPALSRALSESSEWEKVDEEFSYELFKRAR